MLVALAYLKMEAETPVAPDVFAETLSASDTVFLVQDIRGAVEPARTNIMQCGVDFAGSPRFVDKKLVELKERKEVLEARLAEMQAMKREEVDCHALAEQIMATVKRFEDLFPYGTIEERKEFIGLFVDRIELDPDKRVGEVYMKKFPMPVEDIGKSFGLVAGARFEPATFGL